MDPKSYIRGKSNTMIRSATLALFASAVATANSQEQLTYQQPPEEILELVKVDRAPSVAMNSKKDELVFLYSNLYKSIAELSEPELKLGGLRVNPKTNSGSNPRYYTRITIQHGLQGSPVQIKGLPENSRFTNISWSPDEKMLACTELQENGLRLWIINVAAASASPLGNIAMNGSLGAPFRWFPDSKALLVRSIPEDRKSLLTSENSLPAGPAIAVTDGTKAQNRTYQDLLKNTADEQNFETVVTSRLVMLRLDGTSAPFIKEAEMFMRESFSPDGKYVLVTAIRKPFSYIVPYYNFPTVTKLYDASGNFIKIIDEKPLTDNIPPGFMAVQKGKRGVSWRSDKPATLYWAEALDGGDPAVSVPFRDEIFQWDAPFTEGKAISLLKTPQRYAGILWATDSRAIVYDSWHNTRNEKTYIFNPSKPGGALITLFDRNSQDQYNNPGDFHTLRNQYGQQVLYLEGATAYLKGEGYTEKGQFPFIDKINLDSRRTANVFRSSFTDKSLHIADILDTKKNDFLVTLEAPTEYPNYYLVKGGKSFVPVTRFSNPFVKMNGVQKEVITYKRPDGVELSATLYLPAGYDKSKKEKLPMVMWAYPLEYKDKTSASQNTNNPNDFIFPYYGSPIYWVTRGYAILDDAAFPIVGEGDAEPNDSFITQLVANAKAAIDAVDSLGYIDRRKVAVGGHSYGAFMTANLLTHSDLFAAGIARSGAYNRSLTPFGFQGEERNYWEAQKVYNEMSPFNYADKMKTPLLLVHGEMDNNPGTFPIQSERYFAALKGFGAPVRYVVLPKESHGYSAEESILHLLWEQDQWLERHVKNRQ
jgi:dipeptidyl aminopeptidase/acylaminoacyl peptidase